MKVFGTSTPQTGTVFAHLPWGDGDGQVGLAKAREGLTRGPEALAVAPDGRVAVLDSVNRRLVLLDASGGFIGNITVALAQPRFLAVDDQTLYVADADDDHKLVTFAWSGELTAEAALPATTDMVSGLFSTSEGPCVELGHRDSLVVTDRSVKFVPGRPLDRELRMIASATCRPGQAVRVRACSVSAAGVGDAPQTAAGVASRSGASPATESMAIAEEAELRPALASGAAVEHLVSVDSDGRGGLLVGARLVRPQTKGKLTSALAITRLLSQDSGQGEVSPHSIQAKSAAVLLLAECDFAYLGVPYVVAADGRIFQPFADETGYTVLIHTFEEEQP
jgi:hypothetical protein